MTVDFRRSGLLSRRSILGLLGAAPATAALSAAFPGSFRAEAAGSGQLNVYSWPDYFSTGNLEAYAKKSGVTPNITTYDSNETLFAKLNSPAGAGFDIVIPSSSWIKQLADKGLLQEIDHSKLNLASLDQDLLNRDYDPGNKYSIPKDWGLLGVVYDPEAVGGEIETWEDFFKAGEKPGVSGKVRLSDSGWETIGPELWLQGKDWNTATPDEIKAAGERLKAFAKHVKSFSGLDPNQVANGSIVLAQTNNGTARAAIGLNPKLKWVVPGPFSELWVDNYAIVKNAPNVDQAYDFLAYQLQPEVQLEETQYIGFPAALAGLKEKLPADTKNVDIIFGGKDLDFKKLTSFVVNPETIGTYLQVQAEIQAAAGG
ncbi:spermidine/putrescine transport system substrate-binding protein [Kaistia soli DSM 19436]|uniref:Spermidine/putrescine transport system substrate-binding protein n=1 Tax=Kaistia soli DSM 19436 TaxID=1122133 RepID=A0A1M5LFE7_9HYPH|nr:spermidine/putrescine ABC transporter substrate-binding protein [Kaistia soli]SHG63767.1 spermidine/putrescine transport system substrate-binding protein [Kaistia soli DSM 19436]